MRKYALWVAVVLTFTACLYAYFQFLRPLDVFLWDESHHGFYGMQIYDDLKALDWESFWLHTNNQALWMPLHSWLNGFFLLAFGFSYASARLSSLFLFFVCSILIYLIGNEISKEKGWLIGLTAVFLYLTSPMMLHLATVNMQEMMGILICLIIIYFIIRNLGLNVFWKFLFLGFLLSVAYWIKQNYALVLIFGVALFQMSLLFGLKEEKIDLPPDKKKKKNLVPKKGSIAQPSNPFYSWLLNNFAIVLGFLPLFILWWATPPFERKYALTVSFRQGSVAEGKSLILNFIGTCLFYLQSFITSYNLSFWIALGCLSAVVASLFFWRDKRIRIISLMFYANFIFISIMSFAQERYLSLALPLAFLLFGYFFSITIEKLERQRKAAAFAYVILSIIGASFLYDLLSLTSYTKEVANRSIMSFIYKDVFNRFSPPFLFGLTKRPDFTYPKDFTEEKYQGKYFKAQPKTKLQDVLDFFKSQVDQNKSISTMVSFNQLSPYVIYWHFHDWQAPVLTVNDLGFNPKYFWNAEYFFDLQPSLESPYYGDWLEKRWNEFAPILLKGNYIKLVTAKEFPDLGLIAKIYKREKEIVVR
uniref:Glycosyltransferase RgtA/B/C/D-like domain-containing protein n=1 Tax=candidate division CPR3 bacterium TaxID=2268181 RepID=A0A7V3J9G4_UNCC3